MESGAKSVLESGHRGDRYPDPKTQIRREKRFEENGMAWTKPSKLFKADTSFA
jgi:hypothetical protein